MARFAALIAIALDDLRSARRVARRLEQPRERTQRRAVLRHDLEHAAVERDRLVGLAERLFFEDRPLAEQVELRGGVRAADADLEEPAQIVAAIGRAQD